MATLNEYIFSKATNKRPSASPADSSSTLTGYFVNKAMGREDSGQSFEEQLDKAFQMLGKKTSGIKREQYKQITIASNLLEKQQDAQKLIADILNLTEERTALEKQFYQRVAGRQESLETQSVSEAPEASPEPQEEQPEESQKLAAGGTTQVTPPSEEKNNLNERDKQIKFADVMQLQPKASGIAAVSILGEFLSSLGPLAGFFRPYVKNIATPFAVAMGVSQSIINTLLGGPVQAGELKSKEYQKDFGKTWSKFLGDENFISLFIDRTIDNLTGEPVGGFVPANWKDDPEFTAELNRVAQKFNINANDLLAVMLVETGGTLNPAARNRKSLATGLIQFLPSTARGLDTTIDDLAKMTRAQQMKYVEKYLDKWNLPQGATGGQIYAAVFLPAYIKRDVLTVKGEDFYEDNIGLDYNEDNKITRSDLDAHVNAKKKQYKLESGGVIGDNRSSLMPYLLSGPKAGYNVSIQGHNLTLHGSEVVVPFENGLQVYPVLNRRYNIIEDPIGVINRWKQIARGANTDRSGHLTAQDGISLGVKAIQHDEALSSLSRGKNDYIVHGGQSVISSVPWGKVSSSTPLYAYETGVSGDRTTIGWGMTYYDSITNGKKAVKPGQVIKKQQADATLKNLVADYTKTLSSQKWYQKFWNRMSSSQQAGLLAYGYNQPAHLLGTGAPEMYAALNRGDMRAVAANIDRGLPEREKNEKRLVLSGPTDLTKVKTRSNSAPRVIVNRIGGGSSPSFVQQVQQTITRLIPVPVFNSHKLRTELNMKRSK